MLLGTTHLATYTPDFDCFATFKTLSKNNIQIKEDEKRRSFFLYIFVNFCNIPSVVAMIEHQNKKREPKPEKKKMKKRREGEEEEMKLSIQLMQGMIDRS